MEYLKETFIELIKANIIPMIFGPVGLGKTTLAYQLGKELNLETRHIELSAYSGTDIVGFPYVDIATGKGKFADFGDILFPLESSELPKDKDGWLIFLDELTLTEPDTFKCALKILNERMVGMNKIHPKVRFIAAGNKAQNGSLANELPDALVNRMAVFNVDYNPKSLIEWAEENSYDTDLVDALKTVQIPEEFFGPSKRDEPFISNRSIGTLNRYLKSSKIITTEAMQAIIGKKWVNGLRFIYKWKSLPKELLLFKEELKRTRTERLDDFLTEIGNNHGIKIINDNISWINNNLSLTMTKLPEPEEKDENYVTRKL